MQKRSNALVNRFSFTTAAFPFTLCALLFLFAPPAQAVIKRVCTIAYTCSPDGCKPNQECHYEADPSDLDFFFGDREPVIDISDWDDSGPMSPVDTGPVTQTPTKLDCKSTAPGATGAPTVSSKRGDPIDIRTGEESESEVDFRSEGQAPLFLARTYHSFNTTDGIFGRYWQSNFDFLLSTSGSSLLVDMPARGRFVFNQVAGSTTSWTSPTPGVNATITKSANGIYTLNWINDSIQTYSSSGKVLTVNDPSGVGYTFTYDANGYLSRVTSTTGRYVQFTWTGSQLTRVTDPAGVQFNYTYYVDRFGTGKHLLKSVDLPVGSTADRDYLYTNNTYRGALTGIKIGSTQVTWLSYDGAGRAASTERRVQGDPIEKYTFSYQTPDASTLVVNETNPLGKQATYRFVNGDLQSVVGIASASCPSSLYTRTVDANGFTDIVTDFNNHQTDLDYDSAGRLTKEVHGYGAPSPTTVTYVWDSVTGRIVSKTIASDSKISYSYDTAGRVSSVTTTNLSPNGVANQTHVTTYTYTAFANGLPNTIKVDGPLPGAGDSTTQTFDASGNLVSLSDGFGTIATYSNFNGRGQPQHKVDAMGIGYDMTYDDRGRLTLAARTVGTSVVSMKYGYGGDHLKDITSIDGTSESRTFDNADRLITRTVPETVIDDQPQGTQKITQDVISNYVYDANSDLTQAAVVRREVVKDIVYDDSNRPHVVTISSEDSGNIQKYFDYDEMGRLKAARGNHGQNDRYGYDESGLVTSVRDSQENVATTLYDEQNRPKSFTDAKGKSSTFTYDAGGRIKTVTDARGLVTRYTFDGFGQLLRLESPDRGITNYSYDAYGRVTGVTSADLSLVTYTYDGFGRIVLRQSGSQSQTMTYDTCANGLRRLCGYSDLSGSTTYAYNGLGLLTTQTNTIQGTTYTTSFGYDQFDQRVSIVYPDGKSAAYGFGDGKVRSVTATPGGSSTVVADTIRYQPTGQMMSLRYGNGLFSSRQFDTDSRPISLEVFNASNVDAQSLTYTWDSRDDVTAITNPRAAALTQSFVYDELGRLTGAGRGDGLAEGFGYDGVGNRTVYTKTGQSLVTSTYSTTSNRLVSNTQPRSWNYDANGNVTGFTGQDGVAVGLDYDAFGQVDLSTRSGVSVTYLVDAHGQRVSKTGPAGTTRFIYSPDGTLLAELAVGSGWTDYVGANGETLGFMRGGSLYYVHNDVVGRPEVVTDAAQLPVWLASNFAFDRTVTLNSIGGLNIGFPGQYFDAETGTWTNGFRNYDASTGRYLQSDPMGLVAGINTYSYVQSSPLIHADPLGLWPPPPNIEIALGGLGELTEEMSWGLVGRGTLGVYVGVAWIVGYGIGKYGFTPVINTAYTWTTGETPSGLVYNLFHPEKKDPGFMILNQPNEYCHPPTPPPPPPWHFEMPPGYPKFQ